MTARFTKISIEGFKSYLQRTTWEFAPLTVIVGRNNSGKSALIQPLLLLKQTLANPQQEVPLLLHGELFQARLLRDLLSWGADEKGPSSKVRLSVGWEYWEERVQEAQLDLQFSEQDGQVVLERYRLAMDKKIVDGSRLEGREYQEIGPEPHVGQISYMRHFLPFQDMVHNGWAHRAECFRHLLRLFRRLNYMGSVREVPEEIYRPVTVAPEDLGPTGARAAALFKSRGGEWVHYPAPPWEDTVTWRQSSLAEAVNDVMAGLELGGKFEIDDGKEFGYRLLYGGASLAQVGRGLAYVFPVVLAGLLTDPWLSSQINVEAPPPPTELVPLILEEPESHLHPKAQSALAHWLVALARSHRQIVVETHSDHLVRRLRRMIAEAPAGSELETWLKTNVRIYAVEQNEGRSTLKDLRLTSDGGIGEEWPADFMDQASEEDSAIIDAGLVKDPPPLDPLAVHHHDEGEEPEPDPSAEGSV